MPQDPVQLLAALHLSERDLRCYRALLRIPNATPSALSREAGASRGRIYEVLRRLSGLGIVREIPDRPIRYVAVPLRDALNALRAEEARRLGDVDEALRNLPAGPPVHEPGLGGRPRNEVSMLLGRRALAGEVARLVDLATGHVVLSGHGLLQNLSQESNPIQDALRAAARRGVPVQVYSSPTPTPSPTSAAETDSMGVSLHPLHPDLLPPFFLACNERIVVVSFPSADASPAGQLDELSLRIEDPTAASRLQQYLRGLFLWQTSMSKAVTRSKEPRRR